LITGGAGFIGAHLARRLLDDGVDVVLVDDLSRGRQDETFAELTRHARFVHHDLVEPLPDNLLPQGIDTVYHLAAVVGVNRTSRAPGQLLRTNVLAASNLFDWCDRAEPGTVFLSSTSEFADGAARFPAREDTPFVLADAHAPRASYALSKAVAEALLIHRAPRLRVRIGRYFNVYGPRMGHSHVIPQFIDRILTAENPFRIFGAHQTRAFCHIDDAVAATVGLAGLPNEEPIVANIGDDTREITMLDLAGLLFEIAGVAPELEIFDPPPGSPDRRLPDVTTLRRILPARTPVPLETGLRRMLASYQAAK